MHYELYVDEGARYKWLFLLASKSESLANLKKFHVSVERQHDYKLKTIMTDNAKEYMSKELNAYCSGIGIQQLYTNPYSPEENCVVEKSNYTVMNKVRCMLQACDMDNRYWGEALSYVVYTENRSPTKALGGKTPFEALFGRKPNIDHLRPFGCTAFAFIDKAKRTKLDPRATKCVFVGPTLDCRSVKFTEDFVPADEKKVQFNDQVTTHQLQEYEDTDDVESTSSTIIIPREQVSQDSVEASTKAPESPISTNQSDQGHVSDPEQDEGAKSSDQDSSDSEVEFENPTGLEALSGGHHQVFSVDVINDTPQSCVDIEASPNKQAWLDATQDEYNSLLNNGTWVLTDLPPGRKALACKWLWRNKFDAVGRFTKYKARLVIKGFLQRYGLDYLEIFAPVLRYNTLRLVLFLTAFLNGSLNDDTENYMAQPPNYVVPGTEGQLYLTLHQFLVGIGFERCVKEVCLYIKREGESMVLLTVYVDDITITGNNNDDIEKACDELKQRLEMTDLGQCCWTSSTWLIATPSLLHLIAHKVVLGTDVLGSLVVAGVLGDRYRALVVTVNDNASLGKPQFFKQLDVPKQLFDQVAECN
ncbi:hypothetical protein As57867_015708, partial [Aphanomyces stellatus]